jgi:hypothetical protein
MMSGTAEMLGIAFLEMRASRPESTFRPATRQLAPAIRRHILSIALIVIDDMAD